MLPRPHCRIELSCVALLLALVVAPDGLFAQDTAPDGEAILIPKVKAPITLDGRLDEAAWEQARSVPLTTHWPTFEAPPTEKTEILLAYSENYVYAACRCYDSGPPSGPSFKRDFASADSDYFILILDTFNDNENALYFATTPTGLRRDMTISQDAVGDLSSPQTSPFNLSWDTYWSARVRQTKKGWFAEMRIPVSSLRFQRKGEAVRMGLITWRYIARKQEAHVFPAVPPNWGTASLFKPSQGRDVVFEDLQPETPLRVTPYLLAGGAQASALDASATAYERTSDLTYDAGLDVKYGLTSNLTMDLTVNTDFAQVEADNQQINLERSSLFFPEKRRFFQERSSNFQFRFGGSNRMFYSRRIGLYEGRQVRILGGARLVGRVGPWDVGVLNMQTAREPGLGLNGSVLPSENFGVARLRRRVFNPYSYAGAIVTSRLDADGSYNVGYGLDGIVRVAGDDYLTAKWAQTFEDGQPNRVGSLDPARIFLRWERRSFEGLGYDLSYARAGRRYRPAMGFEVRENYYRLGDRVSYGWVPGGSSPIQRHRLNVETRAFFRNANGSIQSLENALSWELNTDGRHSLTITGSRQVEDLRAPFDLGTTSTVPPGRYTFYSGQVQYSTPPGGTINSRFRVTGGEFYHGRRISVQLQPTWNASRYLRLRGFYQLNRIDFPDQALFTSHIGRIRVEMTPSTKFSVLTFVQYNSAINAVIGNLRFRYNPRQGVDFYLVYNTQLNTDRTELATPRLPLNDNRALLLKFNWTFNR